MLGYIGLGSGVIGCGRVDRTSNSICVGDRSPPPVAADHAVCVDEDIWMRIASPVEHILEAVFTVSPKSEN